MIKDLKQIYLLILFFYLVCVFVFSSYHGYLFFVDSQTYLDSEHGLYFKLLNPLYGWVNPLLALFCLTLIFVFLKTPSFLTITIFANPYTLLLLTNYTKEQALFIGLFMMWFGFHSLSIFKGGSLSLSGLILLFIRPIYVPIFIVARLLRSNKYIKFMAIITLLFIIHGLIYFAWVEDGFLSQIYLLRSGIGHVGRDFFPYLCHVERLNSGEFFFCSISSIMGFPVHDHFWGFGGLIAVVFALPIYFMMFFSRLPIVLKVFVFLIYIGSNLVIFWWGPTYGAYLRYSLPVTWILFFVFYSDSYRLMRSSPGFARAI